MGSLIVFSLGLVEQGLFRSVGSLNRLPEEKADMWESKQNMYGYDISICMVLVYIYLAFLIKVSQVCFRCRYIYIYI